MPNLDKQMRKTKKCNFSGAYLFILVFPCRTMVLLPSLTIFLFLDNKWVKLRSKFQKLLKESRKENELLNVSNSNIFFPSLVLKFKILICLN